MAVVIEPHQASSERFAPGSVDGGRVQIGGTALDRSAK
jgi:hypothetical protein